MLAGETLWLYSQAAWWGDFMASGAYIMYHYTAEWVGWMIY